MADRIERRLAAILSADAVVSGHLLAEDAKVRVTEP